MLHLKATTRLATALVAIFVSRSLPAVDASEQPGPPLATVGYSIDQTFEVDMAFQPVPVARVSADGTLYVVDIRGSALLAYDRNGRHLWRTAIAADQTKSSPIAIDIDQSGNIMVFESYGVAVHVLDSSGRLLRVVSVKDQLSGTRYEPRTTGILTASGDGGFQLLAADANAIQRFDTNGRLERAFGAAASLSDAKAGGWLQLVHQQGLYHRRAGTITFDVYELDGRFRRTIRPIGIPFTGPSRVNRPGDAVFATDVLPDGRIVCEIAHRSAYQARGKSIRTSVSPRVYIIDLVGHAATLRGRRPGQFAAAGPSAELYFMETGVAGHDGERPKMTRVTLH